MQKVTMKALVYRSPGQKAVEERASLKSRRPGDAISA